MTDDSPTLPGVMPEPVFFPDGPPHKSGEHTGAKLATDDPERYRLVGELYSQGIGMIKIAEMLHISVNTVLAVVHREAAAAPTAGAEMDNQRAMSQMRHVRALAAEGAIEDLSDEPRRRKISARDKTLILAITTDKIELLSGNATARIEHIDGTKPAADDFKTWLDAGVIPQTDLSEGKCAAKEPVPDSPNPASQAAEGSEDATGGRERGRDGNGGR
jgi:hypothetical protein